ncbi:hypothetical protein K402DRAFT_44145 [Aulographum hederae CBS 113979]|uniref:Uncharacterized protein n=1 Tax=Aulographum hederae CBS 113979 TaxID=1176131 RepID=A0A6G1H3T2_9PEZI|nr:hypothetical protein K402DRAFT_44145 [Aulographum hederae CBS 113979]
MVEELPRSHSWPLTGGVTKVWRRIGSPFSRKRQSLTRHCVQRTPPSRVKIACRNKVTIKTSNHIEQLAKERTPGAGNWRCISNISATGAPQDRGYHGPGSKEAFRCSCLFKESCEAKGSLGEESRVKETRTWSPEATLPNRGRPTDTRLQETGSNSWNLKYSPRCIRDHGQGDIAWPGS